MVERHYVCGNGEEGECYLSLITHGYSHMIVGRVVASTFEIVYPLEALKMTLPSIDDETVAMLKRHSGMPVLLPGIYVKIKAASYQHWHDSKTAIRMALQVNIPIIDVCWRS